MEEISRRSVLAVMAVTPVAAKVSCDDLDEDELALLALCARDFSGTRVSFDPKVGRKCWNIDPAKYPTFDKGDLTVEILESLRVRGLVELHDTNVVLPDGREVNKFYFVTARGREVLAKHTRT